MLYIALVEEKGEGCDYTIDCGKTWWMIEADNMTLAALKVSDMLAEDYWGDGLVENRFEYIKLLEISSIEVLPIVKWHDELTRTYRDVERAKQEVEERELYKRLKTKFENKPEECE